MSLLRVKNKYALLATILILAVLGSIPYMTDSRSTLIFFSQIFIFAVFAMSYDLLLGYTGIISFGHAMFFGLGAYITGICLREGERDLVTVGLAVLLVIGICTVISIIVGSMTLRLQSHYFAMLTLAIAGLVQVGAEKWRSLTHGNDGFTFRIPLEFMDRETFFWLSLSFLVLTYILLQKFIQTPVGKVLQAVRDNEKRASALGYQVLFYKVVASVLAGVFAGLAGVLYALQLRFVSTSVLGVDLTMNVLLMTIIGGVGTLIGPIIGAFLVESAHDGLSNLSEIHWIFERWLILFGLVYILVVLFFPKGIIGTIQQMRMKRISKAAQSKPPIQKEQASWNTQI